MRLRSVDVFRGLTMAGMVVVNNPGDWNTVYPPLLHAEWHGWTPTDLIFPWFLGIMGVSMALAGPERASWPAVMRRSVTLIGLGLFMSGYPWFNPSRWRVPGVLVRIGICYLGASAIWRSVDRPGTPLTTMRRLTQVVGLLLIGYWVLLTFVPPPGGVAGDLSPAGNLGAWLDRTLMGGHLWKPEWDPEGLLSTLPAIASTLIGIVAGIWLRTRHPAPVHRELVVAGCLMLVAGQLWHLGFPINKSLWTSSYVLFTGGAALVVLALLHRPLDGGRASPMTLRVSEPLVALGRNALLLFVLSGLAAKTMLLVMVSDGAGGRHSVQRAIYDTVFAPLAAPKIASLLYAFACLSLLYVLLAALHRRRSYWSV